MIVPTTPSCTNNVMLWWKQQQNKQIGCNSILCTSTASTKTTITSTALFAKKQRRRRRKENSSISDGGGENSSIGEVGDNDDDDRIVEVSSYNNNNENDELPDFDLDSLDASDNVIVERTIKTIASASSSPLGVSSTDLDDTTIIPTTPVRSIQELIADRSLERNFRFDKESSSDDNNDNIIPDFTQLVKAAPPKSHLVTNIDDNSSPSNNSMGSKKKQRQATRQQANARRMKNEGEENESNINQLLAKQFAFLMDEKSGKLSPIKLLEAGAWLGIVLLLIWEIYLNSPLFDRAAPLAPIVYE